LTNGVEVLKQKMEIRLTAIQPICKDFAKPLLPWQHSDRHFQLMALLCDSDGKYRMIYWKVTGNSRNDVPIFVIILAIGAPEKCAKRIGV